jgi:hypothetical protein
MGTTYIPVESASRFHVPRTLASDFTNFLQHDIPGAVGDFTLVTDWYAYNVDGDASVVIRGEIYPDTTKSRYSNTDNNLNFRSDVNSGIKKGDMLIDSDDTIYLLDWDVPPQPNNRMSRALRCNAMLTFSRYQAEEVDKDGYLLRESGFVDVAGSIPCNAYRHDGRLEFSSNNNLPGLIPNTITLLSVQFNDQTKNIKIDDIFVWGNETYVVADVNLVGVNIHGTSGVIQIQAKKKAGGSK